ncbi:MAG: S-methyl-5'-thioadenosine phosphorylase [Candidatus Micrarchaeia archaeon]
MIEPDEKADIGIIGGSGLYDPSFLEDQKEIKVYTPYGAPSENIVIGTMFGKKVAFLARHGRGHKIPPHKVNYRANIWAMQQLGIKKVIGVSAVGSLNLEIKPGDIVVPDQFIDMTKSGRAYTFFDGPVVAHVSMADPFCSYLRKEIVKEANELALHVHETGTYLCIEGPRFSTRAESKVWHDVFKADIIGMTLVPEVNLACEAEMCYATIGLVTDYDVFAEFPVTANEVERIMGENIANVKRLLGKVIEQVDLKEESCSCCHSLKNALM